MTATPAMNEGTPCLHKYLHVGSWPCRELEEPSSTSSTSQGKPPSMSWRASLQFSEKVETSRVETGVTFLPGLKKPYIPRPMV